MNDFKAAMATHTLAVGCILLAALACEMPADRAPDTESDSLQSYLGVALRADSVADTMLVRVRADSTRSPVSDTALIRFGVDGVAKRISVKWPIESISVHLQDTMISHDLDSGTRLVEIKIDSEWGADLVGLHFPGGPQHVESMNELSVGASRRWFQFWQRRNEDESVIVTVEVPICDTVPVIVFEHLLHPQEREDWSPDPKLDSVPKDDRFRLMLSKELSLRELPNCCPMRRLNTVSTSTETPPFPIAAVSTTNGGAVPAAVDSTHTIKQPEETR